MKLFKVIGALIGVLLVTSSSLLIYDSISESTENVNDYVVLGQVVTDVDLYDVNTYSMIEVTTEEVLDIIKRMQNSYAVITHTPTGSTQYPMADYSVINNPDSSAYLYPDTLFISNISYDSNGSPYAIVLTQKDMYERLVVDGGYINAKEIIVNAVQNGANQGMTWTEIAVIITDIINNLKDDDAYLSLLIKDMQDKLVNLKKTYEDLLANPSEELDMDYINRQIEIVLREDPGSISHWLEGKLKLQEMVDLLNTITREIHELEYQLDSDSVIEIINIKHDILDEMIKELLEKEKILKEVQDFIDEYSTKIENSDLTVEETEEIIFEYSYRYTQLYAYLQALLEHIRRLEQEIIQLTEKLRQETINRDRNRKLYEDQTVLARKFIDLYDLEVITTNQWNTLYNEEVRKGISISNNITIIRNDINGASTRLKTIMGPLYNPNANFSTNLTTAYDGYKAVIGRIGLATDTTMANYHARLNTSLDKAKSAIVLKGGYVNAVTFTGIAEGVLTIPQNFVNAGHVHTDSCYSGGDPHDHVASCYTTIRSRCTAYMGTAWESHFQCSSCGYNASQTHGTPSFPHTHEANGYGTCNGSFNFIYATEYARCPSCNDSAPASWIGTVCGNDINEIVLTCTIPESHLHLSTCYRYHWHDYSCFVVDERVMVRHNHSTTEGCYGQRYKCTGVIKWSWDYGTGQNRGVCDTCDGTYWADDGEEQPSFCTRNVTPLICTKPYTYYGSTLGDILCNSGYMQGERRLTCTKQEVVNELVCHLVVATLTTRSNPALPTPFNTPLNKTGLQIVATYLNGDKKFLQDYALNAPTNVRGPTTGSASYTGRIVDARTVGTLTTTFSYTVQ